MYVYGPCVRVVGMTLNHKSVKVASAHFNKLTVSLESQFTLDAKAAHPFRGMERQHEMYLSF